MGWPWQLCVVLLVSLFLPMLVTHTCTGADTDTTQTPSMSIVTSIPSYGSPKPIIRVGIILPQSPLRKRVFQNRIRAAIRPFENILGDKYEFSYESFIKIMMPANATTTELLGYLCETFLPANVSAIIYPTMDESFANVASSQYFLQQAGNLGIPVIAWNADNSGLEQVYMGDGMVPNKQEVVPINRTLPEFSRLASGVRSGNITILDDKTFYIPNLHYDGLGPDAYFWVGTGPRPDHKGFKIPNEKGSYDILGEYEGEDIQLQLPDNWTVYEIDYLSIWCDSLRTNFGHVMIPKDISVPQALGQTKNKSSASNLHIQMAPSIHHQAAAMLSILIHYEWHAFTIVTSTIAGHTDFVQTIRDQVHQYGDPQDTSKPNINFTIIDSVLVTNPEEDLHKIKGSEECIILMYSTRDDAELIMKKAEEMQLTGKNFVWIVTQSVVGADPNNASKDFPVGMLGVHFETSEAAHLRAIMSSSRVFAYGVQKFLEDPSNDQFSLQPGLSCDGNNTSARWPLGSHFYSVLKNVTIRYNQAYDNSGEAAHTKTLEFQSDGTRKDVELKIMNLRKSKTTLANAWEEIGTWSSLLPDKVNLNNIVWPGDQDVPIPGVPDMFHIKKDNEDKVEMGEITGRIVLQQCLNASLTLLGDTEQPELLDIGKGMVVFIGFLDKASEATVNKLVKHITNVRLSGDGNGKRCSILDVEGDILIVPQATLGGKLEDNAMLYNMNVEQTLGEELYNKLCGDVRTSVEENNNSGNVMCGIYGARQVLNMDTNGPFTHIIQV